MAKMQQNDTQDSVNIQGFTVLQVKFSEKNRAAHCLYVKEHTVREGDSCKPRDKTLFVLNVPPYCNETGLRNIFSQCGKIHRVYLHDKPSSGLPRKNESKYFPTFKESQGFKVAYIVFKSPAAVQKAKNLPYSKHLIMSQDPMTSLTGLRKWCKQYKDERVNADDLQKEIDEYMAKYDQKIEKEKERAKQMEGVPDDEGWVTVTRHGKNKGAQWTESQEKKVTAKEKKKRKEKELLNFYTFQIRETKREQIAELRKKFEEDKQRIAVMKASRRFRPY